MWLDMRWYKVDKCSPICWCRSRVNGCHKQSSDLCGKVTCEVKEAFQGFDDVSNDRPAAAIVLLVVLPVSIYSCLFILHGVQPVLFLRYAYGWIQSCKCLPCCFWLPVVAASYPCSRSVAFCASCRSCFVLPSSVRWTSVRFNFRWGRMKSIGARCYAPVICSTARAVQ